MGLYSLKVYLLDHLTENGSWFGALGLPNNSWLEHFQVYVRSAKQEASRRYSSDVDEDVPVVETLRATERCAELVPY